MRSPRARRGVGIGARQVEGYVYFSGLGNLQSIGASLELFRPGNGQAVGD